MTILSVSNPVYGDPANTTILCQITTDRASGTHGFLAVQGDPASARIYADAVAGKYGAIGAYVAPVPSLAALKSSTSAAVSAAASAVVAAVMPDAAHQAAFQNAASILNGSGGAPPSTGDLATGFSALAGAYGLTPTQFASVINAAQAASLTLAAAQSTYTAAANAATNNADLLAALNAFETSLAAVVAQINAALTTPIVAPAAIVIPGLNG